ncbi:MAG: tyrosine-type recombinase/integrase [Solirubrobacterales bacterium]
MATGIRKRHTRLCRSHKGGGCTCTPSYEASVFSPKDDDKIRRTFRSHAEAASWRADAKRQIDQGALRTPAQKTVRTAAEDWLRGAKAGEIRNRSGQRFKPSTLRGYEQALNDRVLPEIGGAKLRAVSTADLQALVDRWQGEGTPASTIRNSIKPLQAIYRRAKSREGLPVNPTRDLELPAPRPKEVQIVAPDLAARLLAVAPSEDRPIWATALYAGLRYGELRALRWGAADLAGGTMEVRESWDQRVGVIEPKTASSRRRVPVPGVLRDALLDLRLDRPDATEDDLVFGLGGEPFHAVTIYRRADAAWEAAGLTVRLRLHQARHTYASFMVAAGVNAKALSAYMGHSSIKVTFDLYGHLMPGAEAEAAALLDTYLGTPAPSGPSRLPTIQNRSPGFR